ncbi:MAG: molybdenum cofactor guanylyltransferase [Bryobacteraceae bacterium]
MSRSELGPTAGYVLAGGASRRMGRDKALLEKAGVPLLKRAIAVVTAAAGRCSVVAPGGRYEGLGVPVIEDLWPGEGPLGGIVTALGSGEGEWNLIVAVDMPFLEIGFLTVLLEEARKGRETVVPAQADGDVEPLCGVYHVDALPRLRQFFDRGGRRVKDALREIETRTVAAPERTLVNVNTPEQWEAARS